MPNSARIPMDTFSSTAQLEEVLDPYLADTNIGIPYWDWTKDSSVPDVWENIKSPIKDHNSSDYHWGARNWAWEEMLSVCHNPKPKWTPQTHALRIRKEEFERIKYDLVNKAYFPDKLEHLEANDPFSKLQDHWIKAALKVISYEGFTAAIATAHSDIHNSLMCTTAFATITAYGFRYVI